MLRKWEFGSEIIWGYLPVDVCHRRETTNCPTHAGQFHPQVHAGLHPRAACPAGGRIRAQFSHPAEARHFGCRLQENKAISLGLAAPHIDGILIKPGETFSFWHLAGNCSEEKGYKMGMTVSSNGPDLGIGGGLCQFTNLLHWMVLHSPLEIVEHHHHGAIDLFPDFNRQIPFGTGTSIVYNYLDYRVGNPTQNTFQFRVSVTEEYLRGELRATDTLGVKFHVKETDSYFQEVGDSVHRHNLVYRSVIDKRTGNEIANDLIIGV